jgi:hypothetical protein
MATLVNRSPITVGHTCMELANFYDLTNGYYSITWPPAYLESWPVSHSELCFTYTFNLPTLAKQKCCVVSVSYGTTAKI